MKTVTYVSPRTLVGLLRIAAQEDVRYYLNGIYFEPDTGILVATDGHALLAHRSIGRAPGIEPFILPRALLEHVTKAKCDTVRVSIEHEEKAPRTVSLECGRYSGESFEANGATFTCKEIDGRFPEWRRVVPANASGDIAQFDPELSGRMHKALADICNVGKGTRLFPHVDHNGWGGALVSCSQSSDTLGVLMPMRSSSSAQAALEALELVRTHAPAEIAQAA